jgi:hypothetical protein
MLLSGCAANSAGVKKLPTMIIQIYPNTRFKLLIRVQLGLVAIAKYETLLKVVAVVSLDQHSTTEFKDSINEGDAWASRAVVRVGGVDCPRAWVW